MRSYRVVTVLLTIAVGAVLTLLYLNFASTAEKKIEEQIERRYGVSDPQMRRSLSALLGPTVLDGNRVVVLSNGDQIFAAMLEAIRSAKSTITFETYIYWSETIGQEFADALVQRASAGVKVHVLLDWVGSLKMDTRYLTQLKAAGVEVERYHQPAWYSLQRLNNRTHRKILVVDGIIGFTGGVGIADQWRGDARNEREWRDTHFRVDGPVVAQMQAVFMDNWIKATGRVLHDHTYFPATNAAGDTPAQMFSSSPNNGSDSMHLMYLMMIAAASKTIELSSSYFVPDELAIKALTAAARRGVSIRIITPGGKIDAQIVRRASRSRWGDLLQAGVQIAEFQPTMFHCKILVVDRLLVSVGSTNFDNRSFRLNDEANLNALDDTLAARLSADFEADWSKSETITLEQWRQRPWSEKAIEQVSSLIGAQL
jgi:cardiolipin synthase A/B